jgi:hypothetical protein
MTLNASEKTRKNATGPCDRRVGNPAGRSLWNGKPTPQPDRSSETAAASVSKMLSIES